MSYFGIGFHELFLHLSLDYRHQNQKYLQCLWNYRNQTDSHHLFQSRNVFSQQKHVYPEKVHHYVAFLDILEVDFMNFVLENCHQIIFPPYNKKILLYRKFPSKWPKQAILAWTSLNIVLKFCSQISGTVKHYWFL